MQAALAVSIFFPYSLGASIAAMTLERNQVRPYAHHTASSGLRPVVCERLLHGSVHAPDRHRRLPRICCSASAPSAVPYDYGHRLEVDRGFMERDAVHTETCTGMKIQAGDHVAKFRSI